MGELFAGRYELLDPVATGGMGAVWRIHDRVEDQVLLAKILRQADAASLIRFVREQSFRINHPHVVTPLSWAGVDDRVLFTMPMVRGGSVAELLRDHGPLPVPWVCTVLDQTLQALEAVHAAGLVHRDIKPGNLLLEPTGWGPPHLRLTDFGIAAPLDQPRMTQAQMVIGSPGYMAPEQLRGADPDPRTDLWALALVANELLTGWRPSAEGQPPDLAPLRADSMVPPGLVEVLAKALAENPDDRYPSAAQMRAALAAVPVPEAAPVWVPDRFSEPPPTATMGTPGTRPLTGPQAPARGRMLSWALLCFGALCLAAGAWLLVG